MSAHAEIEATPDMVVVEPTVEETEMTEKEEQKGQDTLEVKTATEEPVSLPQYIQGWRLHILTAG